VKVSSEIEIDAPPEEVFETVMDPARLGDWVTTHGGIVEEPEGELAEGSTFRQRLRVAGVSFKVRWRVARLDRPKLVEWEGEGPGGSSALIRYTLDPLEGGATRFEYLNEFELPGGKLAQLAGGKIGGGRGRAEAERSLERLKRLLES
jgi:uncharacterized protein YndB with AHSA1/START domain